MKETFLAETFVICHLLFKIRFAKYFIKIVTNLNYQIICRHRNAALRNTK